MTHAIVIEDLSKKYSLRRGGSYLALRDIISNSVTNLLKPKKEPETDFWALKDINLEIGQGERVGIIGHNGAGKSTLLKILSRITPPTSGKIILNGRVASLLEVGTGFHPELTGRENIYLNGSILGIKRSEINKRLEEIIEFSGVEKFIDTPLKNYSSGMQLRLAFSVAAHLQAEILLIDEVLAVGDMEFQQKCIGKMEEISQSNGRTIVFVSHNLGFVQSFCSKTILLERGSKVCFGKTENVVNIYINGKRLIAKPKQHFSNGNVEIIDFTLSNGSSPTDYFLLGYSALINLKIRSNTKLNNIEVALNFKNSTGELISHITTLDQQMFLKLEIGEISEVQIEMLQLNFTPGVYTLDLFILNNHEVCWSCENYAELTILNSDKALRPNGFPSHVKVFSDSHWKISKI